MIFSWGSCSIALGFSRAFNVSGVAGGSTSPGRVRKMMPLDSAEAILQFFESENSQYRKLLSKKCCHLAAAYRYQKLPMSTRQMNKRVPSGAASSVTKRFHMRVLRGC